MKLFLLKKKPRISSSRIRYCQKTNSIHAEVLPNMELKTQQESNHENDSKKYKPPELAEPK